MKTELAWRLEKWQSREGDKGMSGARARVLLQPRPAALTELGRKLLGLDQWP